MYWRGLSLPSASSGTRSPRKSTSRLKSASSLSTQRSSAAKHSIDLASYALTNSIELDALNDAERRGALTRA